MCEAVQTALDFLTTTVCACYTLHFEMQREGKISYIDFSPCCWSRKADSLSLERWSEGTFRMCSAPPH